MIMIYIGNIVMVWCRLGFLLAWPDLTWQTTFGLELGQKLMW